MKHQLATKPNLQASIRHWNCCVNFNRSQHPMTLLLCSSRVNGRERDSKVLVICFSHLLNSWRPTFTPEVVYQTRNLNPSIHAYPPLGMCVCVCALVNCSFHLHPLPTFYTWLHMSHQLILDYLVGFIWCNWSWTVVWLCVCDLKCESWWFSLELLLILYTSHCTLFCTTQLQQGLFLSENRLGLSSLLCMHEKDRWASFVPFVVGETSELFVHLLSLVLSEYMRQTYVCTGDVE
jgi:hypothetical protein